jgi:CBS domain containing-hemolysin-like protein
VVLHELGRQPEPGDSVAVGDATLRVEAVDGLRITRLVVTLSDSVDRAREGRAVAKR